LFVKGESIENGISYSLLTFLELRAGEGAREAARRNNTGHKCTAGLKKPQ
jgi:hypothetical protein